MVFSFAVVAEPRLCMLVAARPKVTRAIVLRVLIFSGVPLAAARAMLQQEWRWVGHLAIALWLNASPLMASCSGKRWASWAYDNGDWWSCGRNYGDHMHSPLACRIGGCCGGVYSTLYGRGYEVIHNEIKSLR